MLIKSARCDGESNVNMATLLYSISSLVMCDVTVPSEPSFQIRETLLIVHEARGYAPADDQMHSLVTTGNGTVVASSGHTRFPRPSGSLSEHPVHHALLS